MLREENNIELNFIETLNSLHYRYREDITNVAALNTNFRRYFEKLNQVNLTDKEFEKLLSQVITSDVFQAAQALREINTFIRDDGTSMQYTLVDIQDWCKNEFEVIRQFYINTEKSHHRYDVMILLNGLPVVQIELKRQDVTPKKAMEQIVDYKRDLGNGYTRTLLCFIQIFVVSNETNTYYFANNDLKHFQFNTNEQFLPIYQFADQNNHKITSLREFSQHFLAKCTLAQMISQYMVLVISEQKLLIMRPYQIYAVKAIMDCIHEHRGNGYIWHTTGSGKTLTSFKASVLLKHEPRIDKCLFVVDRKDLDRQTREEFNKFQADCVEENINTNMLVDRLLSNDYSDKVIVCTIQKLGLALDQQSKRNLAKKEAGKITYKEQLEPLRNSRIVFIFDECHRSQFGENHRAITEFFPQAQLFGFTGTPIFEENSTYKKINNTTGSFKTTADMFEQCLHSYTITHAIDDGNVLRFHVDYFDAQTKNINTNHHKHKIIEEIILKHGAVTTNRKFNAIFATASINDAIEYYRLFQSVQKEKLAKDQSYIPLNIVAVFTPPAEGNKDVQQLQEDLEQEKKDNEEAPDQKKQALALILDDYNHQYKTNHRIAEFDLFYQDVQKRIKDHQYADYDHHNKIDITIVVDMLLTGFDSKYLNTLYVDKNLKYHGLIQAFSRTNRILNGTKPHGNILDFRGQKSAVDEAIKLFSGEASADIQQAKDIWLAPPLESVMSNLTDAVKELETFMLKQGLTYEPKEVPNLKGNIARAEFVNKFKEIQRLSTQLEQYSDVDLADREKIESLIPKNTMRAFRGVYLETVQHIQSEMGSSSQTEEESVDVDGELVLFASTIIDYDYIMDLFTQYTQESNPEKQKMTKDNLVADLLSTSNLLDQKEDMMAYVETLELGKRLNRDDVIAGFEAFKAQQWHNTILEISEKHGLEHEKVAEFAQHIVDRMRVDGEELGELTVSLDLGWKARKALEESFMAHLKPLLEKRVDINEVFGWSAYEKR
ncbi:type I restriction endonuclease subunit R [Entomospira nematocerorum]|uniref:Type I restriction enzyme endonuclease subunit n=1 Tax=Entomospira nematocerorum TaxID=2719987 RepID=A0A968KTT9_9SPIO|nr:type I restriction endonuclease subunit R [Entomospira nematocera]NIZ46549.1 type I restriction endonuclease subunit R [Entomospira nematocera]WDI33652.1 type I restriction endonuclease subunit R [Entomospira nematocera]